MITWRLCRRPHADLSGEGACLYGGRWNRPGRAVVYLADHPALAALELRVHLDLPFDLLPADFVLLRVAAPDNPNIVYAMPDNTASTGDAWLTDATSASLSVPSALVPHARNILLNPRHPDAGQTAILSIEPFLFGPRLWHPLANEG